ncbi:MAG: NAD-dependent epimerase/dehydratase family protein [Xanthomonadaceae bacterium]|nr:NAD-dependent epimerase/dehydratase family protein [Xanthomonadaceae bacterium]
MHVLVTGGSGFIGSHLISRLKKQNPETRISVVDRNEPESRIAGVDYDISDVLESSKLNEWIKTADFVYHLAALVSVAKSQESPLESHKDTVETTKHILDLLTELKSKTKKAPSLIYSSTAAIYGDSVKTESDYSLESFQPHDFLSNYAKHKFEAEELLRAVHKFHALNCCVFRFFNVYGPGQDPKSPYSGVVSIYIDRLKNNLPLSINGDGKQTRDFIYVDDIISGLMRIIEVERTSSAWNGMPINLGSGSSINILFLTKTLIDLTSSKVSPHFAPARDGDVRHSRAETKRARELLSFRSTIDLKTGLRLLLKHQAQQK